MFCVEAKQGGEGFFVYFIPRGLHGPGDEKLTLAFEHSRLCCLHFWHKIEEFALLQH